VYNKSVKIAIAIFLTHTSGVVINPKEVEIMNKYESVIIINPSIEEKALKELVQKFSDLINTDGKVNLVEELGKKKLAYEIQKQTEGYYVVINFEANPGLIAELERIYRITIK
jgi:small subunit ribosomal protein S6